MSHIPLIPRSDWNSIVARRCGQEISLACFLQDVGHCAASLPARTHVLNLCGDRYLFSVGLFAAMLKGNISLLPNATTPELIADLLTLYPDLHSLIEPGGDARGLPQCIVTTAPHGNDIFPEMPQIDAAQIVAKVYTSGSTGVPQAHDKTWGKLTRNILGGAQALWHVTGQPAAVIGTVPSQHMYGFESTVLLPLLSGGILHAEKPFFPADILASLSAAPQPRALITTPFHLKTLLESDLPLPPIDLIVSATAPLSHALAERAEQASGATLLEIYGSTETGQIATRRTVKTAEWRCYADIRLEQRNDCTWASGGHIEMPIALNDVLELRGASGGDRADDNARFILHGRHSDLVNIAGKRTSLAYLNHILNSLPGVVDGVFHLPDEEPTDGIARLNAFVVAPGLSVQHIVTGLREYIDPVFIPRPLVMVDALPRNSTGKLTSAALKDMSARYASQGQS